MPHRSTAIARRLIAARYRTADALRAGWSAPALRARGLAYLLALGVVASAQLAGITEAFDAGFRAALFPLALHGGDVGAVVVSLDGVADLVARDATLRAIRAGRPRAVVSLPTLGDPPAPLGLDGGGSRAERVRCEGSLREGLAALGLRCAPGALVRYAAAGDGTTVLRARAVREGEVPAVAFADAVVVVGDARAAPTLVTPHGMLRPADALAQVLATAARGRGFAELGPFASLFAVALLLAVALASLGAPGSRAASAALVSGACVAGSAALFLVDVSFGPARPVLGTLALALALALLETRAAAAQLGAVVLRLEAVGAQAIDRARHQAVARLACARLGARGAAVLELPAGRWHVRVAALEGYAPDALVEVRRDCRRDPYRESLRAGSVAVPRFFADTRDAVLVPLVVEGVTLGFWALGFDGPPPDRAVIEALAREVAAGLLLAEYEAAAAAGGRRFVSLAARLELLDAASAHLSARVRRANQMLEALPVPLLMTGPWGTVERANRAMRRLLARLGTDAAERDLGRLVASVAQVPTHEAERLLQRAHAGETVPVAIAADHVGWSRLELTWSRGVDGAPGTFALSAVSLDAEGLARARAGAVRDEPSRSGLLPHFGERDSLPPAAPQNGGRVRDA